MAKPKLSILKPAVGVALKAAGVKAPISQGQTIYAWLKDHPRSTASDVEAGTGISSASAAAVLAKLRDQGLAAGNKEWSEHSRRYKIYYAALGKGYVTMAARKPARKTLAEAAPAEVVPPAQLGADDLLKQLNVVQTHEMYLRLKAMFESRVAP